MPLESGHDIVVASTLGTPVEDPVGLWRRESERRREGARKLASSVSDGLEAMLKLGADDFLFRDRENRLGVIAGFCVAGAGAWAAVTIGQATSTARGSNIRGTAESYLVSSQLAKL